MAHFAAARALEDVGHRAAQDAARQRRQGIAAILASRSAHQRKVLEIHQTFTTELALVPAEGTASFLLHYFCCEATARVVVAASLSRPPQKSLDQKTVNRAEIETALKKYGINLDGRLVTRVFGESHASYRTMSARRLRDKMAHALSQLAIDQVHVRRKELFPDMQSIIEAIRQKADTYQGF